GPASNASVGGVLALLLVGIAPSAVVRRSKSLSDSLRAAPATTALVLGRLACSSTGAWAGFGAAISRGLALPTRIPYCFSTCRSARRRIASGVIAVFGVSSTIFRYCWRA